MSTTPVKKFSFGNRGAPPGAQPVAAPAPAPSPAPVEVAPEPGSYVPAVVPAAAPPAFYTGEEDTPVDPNDIRLPRLNIVQKSSQSSWLKHGVGSLLLKGEIKIPLPARIVVMGARPKIYIEKTPWSPNGSGPKARVARSLDEVASMGGTDQWRF